MPFQKGRARTGGRKAGVKYVTIREELTAMLDAMQCNPFVGMARIALDPKSPVAVAAHCHAQLAKYLKPQLKSVEVSGVGGAAIKIDATTSARERLANRISVLSARNAEDKVS